MENITIFTKIGHYLYMHFIRTDVRIKILSRPVYNNGFISKNMGRVSRKYHPLIPSTWLELEFNDSSIQSKFLMTRKESVYTGSVLCLTLH